MTAASGQLALDLALRAAMGREDFLVSPANAAAVQAVDRWPDWQDQALAIIGPAGAGKTHLVEVWRVRAGGARLAAADLGEAAVEAALSSRALAVEDIDRGIADERILFHLLNLARETRLSLLMTARAAPGEIAIGLPDLRSRLRALAFARIEPPDEPLLRGLLVKLFADRQLPVAPRVVNHLALHMERSADAARRLVAVIDRLALEQRSKIKLEIAKEALRAVGRGGDD